MAFNEVSTFGDRGRALSMELWIELIVTAIFTGVIPAAVAVIVTIVANKRADEAERRAEERADDAERKAVQRAVDAERKAEERAKISEQRLDESLRIAERSTPAYRRVYKKVQELLGQRPLVSASFSAMRDGLDFEDDESLNPPRTTAAGSQIAIIKDLMQRDTECAAVAVEQQRLRKAFLEPNPFDAVLHDAVDAVLQLRSLQRDRRSQQRNVHLSDLREAHMRARSAVREWEVREPGLVLALHDLFEVARLNQDDPRSLSPRELPRSPGELIFLGSLEVTRPTGSNY